MAYTRDPMHSVKRDPNTRKGRKAIKFDEDSDRSMESLRARVSERSNLSTTQFGSGTHTMSDGSTMPDSAHG
jgi:hypothetical protein